MPDALTKLGNGLAGAFLAGDWDPPAMARRGQRAVGQRRVWLRDLAQAARHAYPEPPRDRPRELAAFLAARPALIDAYRGSGTSLRVRRWFPAETAMGERRWPVTPPATVGELHDLLGLTTTHLRWFADPKQLEGDVGAERLRHYRYRWSAKHGGGVRLIEAPKPLLKHFQRVLLREILEQIPVHGAVHGFQRGRSALTYSAGHADRAVLVHLDIEDFFGSITAGRVYGIYRQCGYPEPVAHLLTALVTNSIPQQVWATCPRPTGELTAGHHRLGQHLRHPHLPQGAPTSPALANLAAYRLDLRLAGLAARAGLAYTRYADDLALSSSTRRSDEQLTRIVNLTTRIAAEEGFRVNDRKTTIRRAGQRQRLAGVVINDRPNIDRRDYDRLNAILTNAARHGPDSQNHDHHPQFRAHLQGRVAWVEHVNPRRGQRLQAKLAQIDWGQQV